ncbi:MAG: four helix bundle protein [Verrucomicrobiota bacterium]
MSRLDDIRKLQDPTKHFAIAVIRFYSELPKTEPARVIGRQLLRSGTSLAANYRAVCRARSSADFVSKINIVVEETDETLFWLEPLVEANLVSAEAIGTLNEEGNELLRFFSASLTTAKANR